MHSFARVRNLGFWMILSQFQCNSLSKTNTVYLYIKGIYHGLRPISKIGLE